MAGAKEANGEPGRSADGFGALKGSLLEIETPYSRISGHLVLVSPDDGVMVMEVPDSSERGHHMTLIPLHRAQRVGVVSAKVPLSAVKAMFGPDFDVRSVEPRPRRKWSPSRSPNKR